MMILQRAALLGCVLFAACNAWFRRDTGSAALDTPMGRWVLLAGTIVVSALVWIAIGSPSRKRRER